MPLGSCRGEERRGDAAKPSQGAGCCGGPAGLVQLPPGNLVSFCCPVFGATSHLGRFCSENSLILQNYFAFLCDVYTCAELGPAGLLRMWLLCRNSRKRGVLSLSGTQEKWDLGAKVCSHLCVQQPEHVLPVLVLSYSGFSLLALQEGPEGTCGGKSEQKTQLLHPCLR